MAWLSGWAKRVKLTIDQNDIDDALTNFPILVHLGTSVGRNGDDVSFVFDELESNDNRKKIAVTTSDGQTQCYAEIEKWDAVNKEAWLWVKVPFIASDADTDLYLYYDKTHADNTDYVGDPGETPAQNVWDEHFVLVTHMRDDPDSSHVRDSTSYANNGTKKAAGEPAVTTDGQIDDAQDFDGVDDYVEVPHSTSLDIIGNITIEAWLKHDNTESEFIVAKREASNAYSLYTSATHTPGFEVFIGGARRYVEGSTVLSAATWYHVVGTYDGENLRIYLNGEINGTTPQTGNIDSTTDPVRIGWAIADFFSFDGIIDEVRISNVARSAAWIKASFETERDDLLGFGSEEEAAPFVPKIIIF